MGELVLGSMNDDLLFLGMICENVIDEYTLGFRISMIGYIGVYIRTVLELA